MKTIGLSVLIFKCASCFAVFLFYFACASFTTTAVHFAKTEGGYTLVNSQNTAHKPHFSSPAHIGGDQRNKNIAAYVFSGGNDWRQYNEKAEKTNTRKVRSATMINIMHSNWLLPGQQQWQGNNIDDDKRSEEQIDKRRIWGRQPTKLQSKPKDSAMEGEVGATINVVSRINFETRPRDQARNRNSIPIRRKN